MARIELREFSIQVCGIQLATHQFLVKYNGNGDKVELHGVAVCHDSKKYNGAAIERGNLLKVAIYPHTDLHPTLNICDFYGLFIENQCAKTIVSGRENIINNIWNIIVEAGEALNKRDDIKYELSGGKYDDTSTGNSNSIISSLAKVVDLPTFKINKKASAPGLEKNCLISNESTYYNGKNYVPDYIDFLGSWIAASTTIATDFFSHFANNFINFTNKDDNIETAGNTANDDDTIFT